MGRGKIEIKRIENTSNRQVTYSKRKSGIIKKAKEISVLCDAEVSVVIFGSGGSNRMNEYCSPTTSVVDILGKYQEISGRKLWDAKHENLNNEIERVKKENGDLQIKLRHLKGEDITSLSHQDLIRMEEVLRNALPAISARQNELMEEIVKAHQKTEKMLEEENRELAYHAYQEKQQLMMMESNGYVVGDEKDQQQIPYGFRVQPNQLQEERFM